MKKESHEDLHTADECTNAVRVHSIASAPTAIPIFVFLERVVTCFLDISMSFIDVSDCLRLETSSDKGTSYLEKNRLKASGQSAPIILVSCLVSLVDLKLSPRDVIPCQGAIRSPTLPWFGVFLVCCILAFLIGVLLPWSPQYFYQQCTFILFF